MLTKLLRCFLHTARNTLPSTTAEPNAVICEGEVIGIVTIDFGDMFYVLGAFEPAPGFARYEPMFNEVLHLHRRMSDHLDSDDETEYAAASDQWNVALARNNELALSVRQPDGELRPIRDFQLDDHGRVEFKYD